MCGCVRTCDTKLVTFSVFFFLEPGALARAPALFFRLELPDAIVYKCLILLFYLLMLARELMDK